MGVAMILFECKFSKKAKINTCHNIMPPDVTGHLLRVLEVQKTEMIQYLHQNLYRYVRQRGGGLDGVDCAVSIT